MRVFVRAILTPILFLSLASTPARAQVSGKISKIEIKHIGPASVSDELIRANIRVKVGDPYQRPAIDEDVRNLYSTGLFYNIRVAEDVTPNGVVLTYVVQGKPRLTEIQFKGNKKFSDAKLRKKLTSKVGEPLDERKLFTDSQEIQKMYQKSGYPRTEVKAVSNVIEESGRATATFEITESPKVRIVQVEFVGAKTFPSANCARSSKRAGIGCFPGSPAAVTSKMSNLRTIRKRSMNSIETMATSTLILRTSNFLIPVLEG